MCRWAHILRLFRRGSQAESALSPDSGCDCKLSTDTFAGQPWCVMAGFVLVSIPTAAVFLLFQKVILRSIVLPSMK